MNSPIFERQEIIVNPEEDIIKQTSWSPKLKFNKFSSNYEFLIKWLLSQPQNYSHLVTSNSFDLLTILNTAILTYTRTLPYSNIWWVRSLYFCLTDSNLKLILNNLFKIKINFFDNELIKYTNKLNKFKISEK